jgi:3-hydroxyacyl-CoA dehydrogenase
MTVTTRQSGRIGYVTMDNPPVNAIDVAIRQGLIDAVDWANSNGFERVILTGAGRAFAAGADAKEFDTAPIEPHLPDVCQAIESSSVPWIAAINGVALGGGLELAMACRTRIAPPNAQLGLPEVTLGVVPGAGGTQRLPRLVGLAKAIEMIGTGKPVSGRVALEIGLVDQIADDPVQAAEVFDLSQLGVATSKRAVASAEMAEIESIKAKIINRSAGQIAPLRAIELVSLSMNANFAEAVAAERKAFLELRQGEQARALRHIFFAERGAKAPSWLSAEPRPIAQAVVVGGGTMGAGIAYALLNAGIRVVILETDAAGVERAKTNVGKIIDQSVSRGLISQSLAQDIHGRFDASTDYAAAANADLAIEAAFESMDVKRSVFGQLESVMTKDAILATNTSYLDVNEIAAVLNDPSRLVGLHFFAPAHIMKLLEIVRGDETSDHALATGFALAKQLRKIPVLAGVCDGFIGNRILARNREAADTVFMDGSTPWDVDEAMVDFGYAMGPYEAQDLSGLDIAHANRRRQDATRDPARRYIPIADRMVELGKLGRKTGAGWYRYPGGGGKVDDPIVADLALEEAHFAGRTRTDYSHDEIRRRLILAMINEACDILSEGIAQSAADIDLVTVFGYGFPRWRGGLMCHADTIGAARLVDEITELAKEDPVAWRLSPVLAECANRGIALADWRHT